MRVRCPLSAGTHGRLSPGCLRGWALDAVVELSIQTSDVKPYDVQ